MSEGFEKLLVWQKAHALMLFVHKEIRPHLPKDEKWDLADQICRSSKSVGANIAEGHGRFYYKDRVRFCYNARGSLSETENHLIAAKDLGYIPVPLYQQGRDMAAETQRLLNGFIEYLKREKPGKDEPGIDINVDLFPPDPAES
jgi:four helix bundle protein